MGQARGSTSQVYSRVVYNATMQPSKGQPEPLVREQSRLNHHLHPGLTEGRLTYSGNSPHLLSIIVIVVKDDINY